MSQNSEQWQRIHKGPTIENVRNRNSGDGGGLRSHEQGNEVILLQKWNPRLIAQALGVPELHPELERALRQVERSLAGVALNDDRGEVDAKAKEKGAKW